MHEITHIANTKIVIDNQPVEAPMAPINIDGIAIIMQPNAAAYERYWAREWVLLDKTRWKYTCQGMPPNI